MYCPTCGRENQKDALYCRACGEDLTAVAQVMKKHSAVSLISKLDAAIERKNERLRRDAILEALMGVTFAIAAVLGIPALIEGNPLAFLWALLCLFVFLSSGWKYLAYRRSLGPKTKPSATPAPSEAPSRSLSTDEMSPSIFGLTTPELIAGSRGPEAQAWTYCSKCGAQNLDNVLYCRACGCDLDVKPQGVERFLPPFAVRKLDAYIAKKREEEPGYKSGFWVIFVTGVFLLNAILSTLTRNWGNVAVYSLLAVSTFVAGGWDLLVYRRNLEKDEKAAVESDRSLALETASTSVAEATTNQLSGNVAIPAASPSVTEVTTELLRPLPRAD